MPTQNPRINITVDPATADVLSDLAEQENLSVSSLTKQLILDALERREDILLSNLAELRDKDANKGLINHDKAWDE